LNDTATRTCRQAVEHTEWALLYPPSSPSAGNVFGGPVRADREPVWSDRYLPYAVADKVRARRTVVEGSWELVEEPTQRDPAPPGRAASGGQGRSASTFTVAGLSTDAGRADG
jgi:hypothetical protein